MDQCSDSPQCSSCIPVSETVASTEPVDMEVSESLEECVICFQPTACVASLPCDCKVPYCNKCWDKCLAESLRKTHRARCPTCRAIIHPDFDASKGQLVFSREPEPMDLDERDVELPTFGFSAMVGADGEWHSADQWRAWQLNDALAEKTREREENAGKSTRKRLYDQTRPAQIDLLRQWGRATRDALATQQGVGVVPKCLCGGVLQRFKSERYCPHCCRCDLCGNLLARSTHVWTCSNGASTLLHSLGNDVCEQCFVHHSGILGTGGQ